MADEPSTLPIERCQRADYTNHFGMFSWSRKLENIFNNPSCYGTSPIIPASFERCGTRKVRCSIRGPYRIPDRSHIPEICINGESMVIEASYSKTPTARPYVIGFKYGQLSSNNLRLHVNHGIVSLKSQSTLRLHSLDWRNGPPYSLGCDNFNYTMSRTC